MIPAPPIWMMASYIFALEAEVKRLRGEFMWALELGESPGWAPKYPSSPDHGRWQSFMARPELCWTMADSRPFP